MSIFSYKKNVVYTTKIIVPRRKENEHGRLITIIFVEKLKILEKNLHKLNWSYIVKFHTPLRNVRNSKTERVEIILLIINIFVLYSRTSITVSFGKV